MAEWDASLDAPLLDDEAPGSSRRRVVGGGDVASMLKELGSLVRSLKRTPTNDGLDAAWVVAESIQASLRPPHAATLSAAQRRELRSHLVALEHLGGAAAAQQNNGPTAAAAFDVAVEDEAKSRLEIDRPRHALVLQEEEKHAYDAELADMHDRDVARLSTGITTVNQIFSDIAGLITNQQEDVDSIESAIATANTRTNKGHQQLERAERRRSAKMKCCFYFAVGLAIFAVFLVLAIIGFKNLAGAAAL